MKLTPQQKAAVEKIKEYKVWALLMAPWTGKTYTAYLLSTNTDAEQILWFTPVQNIENTTKELQKYWSDPRIQVVGLESVGCSDRIYLQHRNSVQKWRTFIVLDESIKIKNLRAKRTKRLIDIGLFCSYKLILNWTPVTKNIMDLWSQFEFLSPSILQMGLEDFKYTFCDFVRITKRKPEGKQIEEKIKGYRNLDYLKKLIEPYVYECNLELSIEKNFITEKYEIDDYSYREYLNIKDEFLSYETLEEWNNNVFLAMCQSLQQSYSLDSNKLELLDKIIHNHIIDNIIIFCKFRKTEKYLKERYPNITILTYGKHSFGLNLQEKNITIYFDKTFDYSHRVQSEFRTYRLAQQKDCIYYDLTSDTPLDTFIDENIRRKTNISEALKKEGITTLYHKFRKWKRKPYTPKP